MENNHESIKKEIKRWNSHIITDKTLYIYHWHVWLNMNVFSSYLKWITKNYQEATNTNNKKRKKMVHLMTFSYKSMA